MTQESLQLGATFILALGLLRIIEILITKYLKNGKKDTEFNSTAILDELVKMNTNHLHGVQDAITNGNKDIVKAISDMHLDLVKELNKK